ncbi:MAG: helical backbone metal receptor [Weeksellaceae bacterium]|nr:ABC transporter substrate-binding protein [Bacteroidota bacterium]MCG2779750.1 helical backbone metal receptor [Weeksellaceae bacterium]
MKIISLVPSITETLFDFGLNETEITGRTKFCIHPENSVRNVEIIGGTKNLNIEKIKSLKPDLIIANKEENVKEQIKELDKNFKVLVTNISTLEDNYYLLKNLGNLLNRQEIAQKFNMKIYEVFHGFSDSQKKKCAYLIWKNPYMTVGSDTFIHDVLDKIGFENVFKNRKRYPEISVEEMKPADYIFLSSEPFPFQQKHIDELQKKLPDSKIILVDGEAFSWYGTHLAKCENYFKTLAANCK